MKNAVPVYQSLEHPHLIKLLDNFPTDYGFAVVFQWFEGECLHSHWSYGGVEKYTNPKSPFIVLKFRIGKTLKSLRYNFSFHTYVESKNYVAVDLYDGSILYDFKNDETKYVILIFIESRLLLMI